MSEQMDRLIQQMVDVTELFKAHQGNTSTLDEDKLKALFVEAVQGMTEEKLVRRGESPPAEGELVGPPGFRMPSSPMVRDGKFAGKRVSDLQFASTFLKMAHVHFPNHVTLPSAEMTKVLTSTGTGTGDELVPQNMAAELWEDFFLASRIVSNIGVIDQPTDPFDMPLGLGDFTWRKGGQGVAVSASDPSTADSTFTSTEQVAEVNWTYNLDEDAIIAMMPALRARIGISGGEQMDAFCLNADSTDAATGNINLDDADPDADSYYLTDGQDGIRHQWLVDNTPSQSINAGGDALSDSDVLNAQKAMGKYAVSPDKTTIATDVSTYIKGFLALDGVFTLDKYGPEATVLTGELAKYRGIPIILSASAPLTEADGKVSTTAGNNTLGQFSLYHNDMWNVGFRRQLLIEVDRDIQRRLLIMVISFRIAIATHGTRASNIHTAGVRNILV